MGGTLLEPKEGWETLCSSRGRDAALHAAAGPALCAAEVFARAVRGYLQNTQGEALVSQPGPPSK